MSDPNFIEQASALAANAGIDPSNVIDAVSAHVPGGEAVAGVLKTGVDLVTKKNTDDSEESEGAGGIMGAVGGLLGNNSEA
jgi:chaperonin GroEL (HSP60 family)